jgi:hypothetical protein
VVNIGSGPIYKDATGNVGIGTTSPATKLQIQGAGTTSAFYTNGDAVGQTLYLQDTGNLAGNGGQILFGASQGIFAGIKSSIVSGTGPAGNLILQTRDTSGNVLDRMVVTREGLVGIGTSSPASTLQVVGSLILNGGNTSNTTLTNHNGILLGGVAKNLSPSGGQNAIEIVSNDSSNRLEAGIVLLTSATESNRRLAIGLIEQGVAWRNVTIAESGGNVGIGTANPSAQLELSADSAKKPSTNTWTIASDQRLKTNITNADNDRCYEIVKQVPLKRYTWKSEVYSQEKVKDRSKLGWIAQDVEEVFPKAVGTSRFIYNQVFEDVVTPELDYDGNAVLDENGVAKTKTEKRLVSEDVIEDCKDLNSDQIYAAMYGAIQRLIEKVELLESKVATLEAA